MNGLIENIYEHKKNDPKIVHYLMDLLDRTGIKSALELQQYENGRYTIAETGQKLTDEEILRQLELAFVNDETHFDYLDTLQESELKVLYEQFKQADIENKKILIIKIYSILDWGVPLPFEAYKLMMEDKLV